ncbi:MAG: DUF1634 domain-containing protein [Sphaerospermopsis kisseleviana]|uniref:DUF1634 domain-containing protein n=1 Tax=Sphaerospermopsis reniformis TaxID=531300 RepID=A0A480A023_9CYAN|nr:MULTISPECIES: DUF1634 domain-containing protein [Sphaerospermopsis]MBD2133977.1 DUF1634 domain-containing protein [Sphaerospermopsis sp. FACHB-1094]MBD2145926.1 DUF1634 domain-containing protein [Sphaerospermopsis sp. FACHB-1194]GCL37832.1 hypothetical protein SR1949_29440 [Sphaerospermopsis reniformis]
MYRLNSGFRWTSSIQQETEVMTLALISEEPDSDIQQLEKQHFHHVNHLNYQGVIANNHKIEKLPGEQLLENLLSNLLRYGVLIASSIVFIGGILHLINHGSEPAQYHIFRGTSPELCSPIGVFTAILSGSRRAIIQLGLLILIAVPVLRVLISFLTFLFLRQFIYVVITSLVLTSLIYSLLSAY